MRRASAAAAAGPGPLRVEDPRFTHSFSHAWVAAAAAAGLPGTEDLNAATQDGAGFYQATQRDGRRWSAADGYLRPALGRSNLTVVTDAVATRVLVEHGRAVGVRYRHAGADVDVRVDHEVLLSGGAVASPTCCCCRASVRPTGSARTASR